MKTIIAGSRSIRDYNVVEEAMKRAREVGIIPTEIVSGGANGVDCLGEWWAGKHSVAVKRFPANWRVYGRAAGFMRNAQMAAYADALVAVWDGESKGTANMILQAHKCALRVYVYYINPVKWR